MLGLTDHDSDVYFQDLLYHAQSGMSASAIESSADLAVDGMQLAGIFDSPYLSAADLRKGLYDGADIQLWLVDWHNPEDGTLLMRGRFGEVKYQGDKFTVDLEGPATFLRQPGGRVYQNDCDAELGDTRCRVNLNEKERVISTTIEKASGLEVSVIGDTDFITRDANWFAYGKIDFTSGVIAGFHSKIRSDISTQTGRKFTLFDSLPDLPSANDYVKITVGCDKKFQSCGEKFANKLNFQGFPHLPSGSVLLSIKDRI